MADLVCEYTLATPGGTVVLNDGLLGDGTDKYWVENITGLDGAPLRTPIDNRPQTHGGLVHRFFKGPRHPVFEGKLLVETVPIPSSDCQAVWNTMEAALLTALESILDGGLAVGTLSWTPAGQAARSLTDVQCEVPLDIRAIENYHVRTFTFGLVAPDPDW